jgi:alkylhydroperoxidase family enzyme
MAHVPPRPIDEVLFLQPVLENTRRQLGFEPNSLLTMAHLPHAALAFGLLMTSIRGGDLRGAWQQIADHVPPPEDSALNVEPVLLQLAAFAVSVGAGCRYCQAHTGHTLEKMTDLPPAKIADLLRYEHSPHYSLRERAVVALALAAAERRGAPTLCGDARAFQQSADRADSFDSRPFRFPKPMERHHGDNTRGCATELCRRVSG